MEYTDYKYEDWLKESWTHSALDLLNESKNILENKPINLIVRHSHRIETNDIKILINLGLTQKGKDFAFYYGKNLPKNRPINIYHSISPRC